MHGSTPPHPIHTAVSFPAMNRSWRIPHSAFPYTVPPRTVAALSTARPRGPVAVPVPGIIPGWVKTGDVCLAGNLSCGDRSYGKQDCPHEGQQDGRYSQRIFHLVSSSDSSFCGTASLPVELPGSGATFRSWFRASRRKTFYVLSSGNHGKLLISPCVRGYPP